jgi:hypothetical protein
MKLISGPADTRNIRIRVEAGKNIQRETTRDAFESAIAFSRRIAPKTATESEL